MSHFRNLEYLNKNRIIYRQNPKNDKPTEKFEWGYYYENGTNECYELFRSKAKINTFKALKWHLYVLWYLNPQLDQNSFLNVSRFICDKTNGFITFDVSEQLLQTMIYEVSLQDLETPPLNKSRKIIFKDNSGLSLSEKLSIVGKIVGKSKIVTDEDGNYMCIYS